MDGALLSGAVTLVILSMNKQEDPSCNEGKLRGGGGCCRRGGLKE